MMVKYVALMTAALAGAVAIAQSLSAAHVRRHSPPRIPLHRDLEGIR
jgi:hypothetical protein